MSDSSGDKIPTRAILAGCCAATGSGTRFTTAEESSTINAHLSGFRFIAVKVTTNTGFYSMGVINPLVCNWHLADMPTVFRDVRCRGSSGHSETRSPCPLMTHSGHTHFGIFAAQIDRLTISALACVLAVAFEKYCHVKWSRFGREWTTFARSETYGV